MTLRLPEGAWHTDPRTLREVVDDPSAVDAALAVADELDRVWLLRLAGRLDEALAAGHAALAARPDRFRALLLVAHVHLWRGEFAAAERLQAEALQRADTDARRATARQHIGRRLFEQGRFAWAATEFAAALALRERIGADPELLAASRRCLVRARLRTGHS